MWLRNLPGTAPAAAISPGGGSSGFTNTYVLLADVTGAINEGPAPLYRFVDTTGAITIWILQQGAAAPTTALLAVEPRYTIGDVGGAFTVAAGDGCQANAATPGGGGGAGSFRGGNGGAGDAAQAAGFGGAVSLRAGIPGADAGGGGAAGGSASVQATAGTGAGATGDVLLGTETGTYQARYVQLASPTTGQVLIGVATPSAAEKFRVDGTVSPLANANGYVSQFGGTLVEAGSGTHAVMAGAAFLAPTITAGVAATTRATNVYVAANPTGGTSNWGLLSDGDVCLANNISLFGQTNGGGVNIQIVHVATNNFVNIGTLAAGGNGLQLFGCGGDVRIPNNNLFCGGAVEIDGALNHDGTTVGFYGTVPVVRAAAPTAPAGGVTVDAESRTAINELIAALGAATGVGLTA